jgi:hypothetical protein
MDIEASLVEKCLDCVEQILLAPLNDSAKQRDEKFALVWKALETAKKMDSLSYVEVKKKSIARRSKTFVLKKKQKRVLLFSDSERLNFLEKADALPRSIFSPSWTQYLKMYRTPMRGSFWILSAKLCLLDSKLMH